MNIFVTLELPKEMDLFLNLPTQPNCDNLKRKKINCHVVNNMHSDPLQELICNKICISFRSTYTKLFEHIEIEKSNFLSTLETPF